MSAPLQISLDSSQSSSKIDLSLELQTYLNKQTNKQTHVTSVLPFASQQSAITHWRHFKFSSICFLTGYNNAPDIAGIVQLAREKFTE